MVLSQTTHFAVPLSVARRCENVTAYSAPQRGQKKELPGVISPVNGMRRLRSLKAIVRLLKSLFQNRPDAQLDVVDYDISDRHRGMLKTRSGRHVWNTIVLFQPIVSPDAVTEKIRPHVINRIDRHVVARIGRFSCAAAAVCTSQPNCCSRSTNAA
jgi:hypothetical protein